MLLFTTKKGSRFKYHYHFPLTHITALDVYQVSDLEIFLLNDDEEYCMLYLESPELFTKWRSELESCLEDIFTKEKIRNPDLKRTTVNTGIIGNKLSRSGSVSGINFPKTLNATGTVTHKKKRNHRGSVLTSKKEDATLKSPRKESRSSRRKKRKSDKKG